MRNCLSSLVRRAGFAARAFGALLAIASVAQGPIAAAVRLALAASIAACAAASAGAEQSNPGDIVVIRKITPRSAFVTVPKNEDPIATKVETFPTQALDATVATLMSDVDLAHAHGSGGLGATATIGHAVGGEALGMLLGGASAGTRLSIGPGTATQTGVGGAVATSVTGALAPLSTAFGALK
jgi:hypothetical protein